MRKRLDGYQLESNGNSKAFVPSSPHRLISLSSSSLIYLFAGLMCYANSLLIDRAFFPYVGLFAQHVKKLKLMKQSLDNSFDNSMPMSGSVASPVASQMSNMSNQSKIIKLIRGRDRVRKAKALKVTC